MKKRLIGKTQLILGVFVLILSISGCFVANNLIKERNRINENLTEEFYGYYMT